MTTCKFILGLVLIVSLLLAQAGTGAEPRPMRRDALTEGRGFSYNTEAFINRLDYRFAYWDADVRGDGAYGVGGSVKSNELYLDMVLKKTLTSDSGATELIFKSERYEDFDGYVDSFIVGLAQYVTPTWKVAILGDIYGDKAESDVHFETQWTPSNSRLMRLGLILPDAYYNSKRDNEDPAKYDKKPQTWFLNLREGSLDDTFGEITVNYSPEATFNDPYDGLIASGEQTLLTLAAGTRWGEWMTRASFSAEWTDRDFAFSRTPAPDEDSFDRRAYEVVVETHAPQLKYWPRFGIRHFYLKEQGWFGDARDISGRLKRREPAIYGGCSVEMMPDAYLEPMLYVSWADINHTFDDLAENRDEEKVLAKLNLNAKFILNKDTGAYFSIAPSFHLHKGAFGGGSIRIVWPF